MSNEQNQIGANPIPFRDGHLILSELVVPNRGLAFVDDSGTPQKPIDFWAGDYHVLAAVVIEPEKYTISKKIVEDILANFGMEELHATEIVSPKKISAWRRVPITERIGVIKQLFEILNSNAIEIPYVEISGEQFEKTMRQKLPKKFEKTKVKDTLVHVFYDTLVKRMHSRYENIAIVADSTKESRNALRILAPVPNPERIYENGVIETDSKNVIGVQLADFAAYVFNRRPHSVSRIENGKGTEFDVILLSGFKLMRNRYLNLLDLE